MKKTTIVLLLFLSFNHIAFSQCFDCGQNIGQWTEDYPRDINKVSDGIIVTTQNGYDGQVHKYDFNCNLLWTSTFFGEYDFIRAIVSTVDDEDNIYTIIDNTSSVVTVNGVTIPNGASLFKMSANGTPLWCQPTGGHAVGLRLYFWQGNIFIAGQFSYPIDFSNTVNVTTTANSIEYYVVKYTTNGVAIDAQSYGVQEVDDYLTDSAIDNNGNIFLLGRNSSHHIMKIDPNLNQEWIVTIDEHAHSMYYNDSNNKLYLHQRDGSNSPPNYCETSSKIREFSAENGVVERTLNIPNCSYTINNTLMQYHAQMAHYGNDLYVFSNFQNTLNFGGVSTESSPYTHGYNQDMFLFKIDLNDFSPEVIFSTSGENWQEDYSYSDHVSYILVHEDNLYLTASFQSYPLTINNTVINNNSGNTDSDVLFYKYNLLQETSSGNMTVDGTCINENTQFEVFGNFDSVLWNFDDPSTGINNISDITNPVHVFSSDGTYNVSVEVTCGAESQTIYKDVTITTAPSVNEISDLIACEDTFGSNISSAFDTSQIESEIIGNLTDISIIYQNQNGDVLPSPLPNPMTNTIANEEIITAQVFFTNNTECYAEVTFSLLVESLPEISPIDDILTCDDNDDGIATFDFSNIENEVIGSLTNVSVDYFDSNDNSLNPLPTSYTNIIPYQDFITARVIDNANECYTDVIINLIINTPPTANALTPLTACDNNNDGISTFFDTSTIETNVTGNQTNVMVTYYDTGDNALPSPLPNPYTNTTLFTQNITVRVTDVTTDCYSETILTLNTSAQPSINQPNDIYACNQGDGFANFDTTNIESELIGTQTGLAISYFDQDGNQLSSPLPSSFQNTTPYTQTINVRVEDASSSICYSETYFDLIVIDSPEIDLEENYYLCDLEPSLSLAIDTTFDSYSWTFEDGTFISNTHFATVSDEGSYTVHVSEFTNGISCENTFTFQLIRSDLPTIQTVNFDQLGNNYIEIIAVGDGDFEYSIDGINYQDSNLFENISGGTYTAYVRDKDGCGEDNSQVTLLDYPNFFTPNNDTYNDSWNFYGIENYPDANIIIFDRFGKIIKELINGESWDGNYRGRRMPSSEYWFLARLNSDIQFRGHFSLVR
ncbi:T9SS type B sorting domain-containing protein [Kordia sp.]|uniref:T9SS type B sorting domain-containing protein n=1 Tax=Kordia sp. TaxID=1965332 RepID=UPI003D2D3802